MKIKNSIRRFSMAMVIVAAMALVTAGSALATGTASYASGKITFTAGVGDDNTLTYDWTSYGWQINDVVPITPGSGCTAIDADSVLCDASTSSLVINLGDQDDFSDAVDPSAPGIPTVNGGDGNDILNGSDSMERFNGEAGNDTINTYGQFDTINGGDGDDTISAGDGDDVVDGGLGSDRFAPGAGSDKLTYGARTANLFVEVGGYSGQAGEGDMISQYDGFEKYSLGLGDDSFYGVWSNVPVYVAAGNGNDTIHGTSYGDVLNGQNGNDVYRGGLGDDMLYGLAGDDLRGDGGFDLANWTGQLSSLVITVDDVANDGPVANPVGNVHTDIEKVAGGNYADTITGQSAASTYIVGNGSNDTLTGGSAADTLDGSIGNDTLNPGGGADSALGGSGVDSVIANDGVADTLDCGDDSPDLAYADTGIDSVTGCESILWY